MRKFNGFCFMLWLSGFFTAGALVHAVRGLLRYTVVINGMDVPLNLSFVLCLVFAVLSAVTAYAASQMACCKK